MINQRTASKILRTLVYLSATVTFGALLLIVAYILYKGAGHITPELFALKYTSDNGSLFPAMVNTVMLTGLALLCSGILGIFTAIYLVEYASKDSHVVALVRLTAETLSGIPSIIYGLFGFLFFVVYLGWGYSLLAGVATISIMILPVIIRTSEEALKAVPDSFREGSFGLGAGKLRTVFRVILPSAAPGILSGVILSTGRIVGETAALIYTAGTVANIPKNLFSSGRTLSVHMYVLWKEGFGTNQSYATAVVLLGVVLLLNALSSFLAKRLMKGKIN